MVGVNVFESTKPSGISAVGGEGDSGSLFSLPAIASSRWMRRVNSFWRSGVTKVYSPVISRSEWPAIF